MNLDRWLEAWSLILSRRDGAKITLKLAGLKPEEVKEDKKTA